MRRLPHTYSCVFIINFQWKSLADDTVNSPHCRTLNICLWVTNRINRQLPLYTLQKLFNNCLLLIAQVFTLHCIILQSLLCNKHRAMLTCCSVTVQPAQSVLISSRLSITKLMLPRRDKHLTVSELITLNCSILVLISLTKIVKLLTLYDNDNKNS